MKISWNEKNKANALDLILKEKASVIMGIIFSSWLESLVGVVLGVLFTTM